MLYDINQLKLGELGNKINTFKFAVETVNIKFDTIVICPFCLTLKEFGKNFSLEKGSYKCQFCQNLLKKETIKKIINIEPEEYALWVYEYRINGFWKKIYPTFNIWNLRLSEFKGNFSKRFWDKYREIKGENFQEENE